MSRWRSRSVIWAPAGTARSMSITTTTNGMRMGYRGLYSTTEMTITAGSRLGRYAIHSQLGAGGMGEVFLAEDTQLGRRVAIKLLPAETAADERARRRLIREARAAATLDHPHICAVYEVGEADGLLFIAMQYVEGQTLAARLRRGEVELAEALTIATQV